MSNSVKSGWVLTGPGSGKGGGAVERERGREGSERDRVP